MWKLPVQITVAELALLISAGSLILSGAALVRTGRKDLEEQRDRLLAQITELTIDAEQRDSELVALLHLCSRCPAKQTGREIQTTTELLHNSLREQLGSLQKLFSSIAQAPEAGLRALLRARRIELFRHIPLLAGQMKDIESHIQSSKDRLLAAGT